MIEKLRIINYYKYTLFNTIKYFFQKIKFKRIKRDKSERTIFIIGVPDGVNLGDHAIGVSQRQYAQKYFPEYKVVEILTGEYWSKFISLKKGVKKNDLIFITGGGNMGNEYLLAEDIRRSVIKHFTNNVIVSLPQTIFFWDNVYGRLELNKSIRIYSRNKNLILFAREKKSFNEMKDLFKKNIVHFLPDIVFTMKFEENKKDQNPQKRVLLLLRKDNEKVLSDLTIKEIEKNLFLKNYEVVYSDTCLKTNFPFKQRKEKVKELMENIQKSEFVITDRLHGMIFSAICFVPALVFSNYNHKIPGTFDLIQDKVNYIKNVTSDTDFDLEISNIMAERPIFKNDFVFDLYEKATKIIMDKINENQNHS